MGQKSYVCNISVICVTNIARGKNVWHKMGGCYQKSLKIYYLILPKPETQVIAGLVRTKFVKMVRLKQGFKN